MFYFVFSVLINFAMSGFVIFTVKNNPIFTGDYNTEDINLVARIQRANFLGEVLKKQFEIDGGKNLPTIISKLAQNSNPQLWTSGELKMSSQSFTILTKEETEAVIAHELAHLILGHSFKKPNEESVMEEEIEADRLVATRRYVSRQALIRAIEKLSKNEEERATRVEAIGE